MRQLLRASARDVDHSAVSVSRARLQRFGVRVAALGAEPRVHVRHQPVPVASRLGSVHGLRPPERADALRPRDRHDDAPRGRSLGQLALVRHRRSRAHTRSRRARERPRAARGQQLRLDARGGLWDPAARLHRDRIGLGRRLADRGRRPGELVRGRHRDRVRLRPVAARRRRRRPHRDAASARRGHLRQPRRGSPHRRDPQRCDAALRADPAARLGREHARAGRRRPRRRPRHRARRRRRVDPRSARRDRPGAAGLPDAHERAALSRVVRVRERRSPDPARGGDRCRSGRRHRRRRLGRDRRRDDPGPRLRVRRARRAARRIPGRRRSGALAAREPQPPERHAARLLRGARARRSRRTGRRRSRARDPRERPRRQPLRLARRRLDRVGLPGAARRSFQGLDRSGHGQGDTARGRRCARARGQEPLLAGGRRSRRRRPSRDRRLDQRGVRRRAERLRDRVEHLQRARHAARQRGRGRLLARHAGPRLRGQARRQRRIGRSVRRGLARARAAAHARRAPHGRHRNAGLAGDHRHPGATARYASRSSARSAPCCC